LTQHLRTKSDKIRALDKAGYKRARIADFLGIRYQHVRNVLVQPAPRRAIGIADPASRYSASLLPPAQSTAQLSNGRFTVDSSGRIALPPFLLARLMAAPGDEIPWWFEDGRLQIASWDVALKRAQDSFAAWFPNRGDMVEEYLSEKRAEAQRENAKDW
jgi:hypothetical protein